VSRRLDFLIAACQAYFQRITRWLYEGAAIVAEGYRIYAIVDWLRAPGPQARLYQVECRKVVLGCKLDAVARAPLRFYPRPAEIYQQGGKAPHLRLLSLESATACCEFFGAHRECDCAPGTGKIDFSKSRL
jgi:hypothetical protein